MIQFPTNLRSQQDPETEVSESNSRICCCYFLKGWCHYNLSLTSINQSLAQSLHLPGLYWLCGRCPLIAHRKNTCSSTVWRTASKHITSESLVPGFMGHRVTLQSRNDRSKGLSPGNPRKWLCLGVSNAVRRQDKWTECPETQGRLAMGQLPAFRCCSNQLTSFQSVNQDSSAILV